jgi:hypothetical protein
MKAKCWLLLGELILVFSAAWAAEVKELNFQSDPPGASVFLLQGARQVPVGKTPVEYPAEFHSNISILRFEIQKAGHKSQTIEVNAQQTKVFVKLAAQGLAAPAKTDDPELTRLHTRLGPSVERALLDLPEAQRPYRYGVTREARLTKLGGRIVLVVAVDLEVEGDGSAASVSDHGAFLRSTWDRLVQGIATRLAKALHPGEGPTIGLIIDVRSAPLRPGFAVSSRSVQEMECVSGMVLRQVWDPCARSVYDPHAAGALRCEGGLVGRMVTDPCASRVPVTRVRVDPAAPVGVYEWKARYVLPPAQVQGAAEEQFVYERLGLLLTGRNGELRFKRGEVP